MHPDWSASLVEVTDLLEMEHFRIHLLHPIDLVVTKLGRGEPQDVEDGVMLRRRYLDDASGLAARRVRAAWEYRPPSERERRSIEAAFEAIFEQDLGLLD